MSDTTTTFRTVSSKDGTRIAYDVAGSGPALILVDGAMCSRGFGPMPDLSKHLQKDFTVYNYDRRGRGDSGNVLPYSPEREVEDLAAMITEAGGTAVVFGISSGGGLALRAAAAGLPISRLAIYEAPYMVSDSKKRPDDMLGDLDRFIATGNPGGAVRYFMVEMVGAPAIATVFMRAMPKVWKQMLAVAPTIPNDARVMGGNFRPDTVSFSTITAPALVMRGGKAAQWMTDAAELLAKTLPHSSYKVLPKQTHQVKSAAIAPSLIEFLSRSD
jgi:pimeloyl-ACP methyl ester carboxylesterase